MHSDSIKKKHSKSIDFSFQSKIQKFLLAAILAWGIVGTAINIFFQNLYYKGLQGLGDGFQSPSLVWGTSISWNIFHFLILLFIAGLFGFIFGFFSQKVSVDDKVLFGTLFLVFHFFLLGFLLLIADIIYPGYWTDLDGMVNEIIFEITSSRFIILFILLDSIGMIFSAIYFMKPGTRAARNSNQTINKKKGSTFLGIRLYHYSWIWLPVILYSQLILNFLYLSVNAVIILTSRTKRLSIPEGGNIINGANANFSWGNLFWVTVITGISIFLLAYLQKILSGKIKKELSITIIMAVGIGFVIPMIIFFFTPFA